MTAIRGIERDTLQLIQESAREVYPNEFGGFLAVGDDPSVISEIVLLPGTISGSTHAIFRLDMSPPDSSIVGTVHSHPSPYPTASEADMHLFQKYGRVHVITAVPYDDGSWRAYDHHGERISLEVVEP
ncbi:MAG: Mov34/MPN/PAD-1 family protein [Thermoplasmatota archaeon]